MIDKMLLNDMYKGFDNVGGDNNLNRLAKEIQALYIKGYTEEELLANYQQIKEENKFYFYEFGKWCEWNIEATLSNETITFSEKVITYYDGNYSPTNSLARCDSNQKVIQLIYQIWYQFIL